MKELLMSTRNRLVFSSFMIAVVSSSISASSSSAAIITPISASSPNGSYSTRTPTHTIDSSGLSPNGIWDQHTSGGNVVEETIPNATMWLAAGNTTPEITWNLGAIYNLAGFHLWNYNEAFNSGDAPRSIQTADVSISNDGTTFTPFATGMTFTEASGFDTYTGEDYAMVATAQYVRFNVTSNYGDGFGSGLSEIRFVTAVPEPMSITLICFGALGVMLAARRRR
jgi:hypothetical protein